MFNKPGFLLLLAGIFLVAVLVPFRAREPRNPLDAELRDCLKEHVGEPKAILDCSRKAQAKWYGEMETAYNQLLAKLSPAGKKLFEKSHANWLNTLGLEMRLLDECYGKEPDAKFLFIREMDKLGLVRGRVLQLRRYLEVSARGEKK